MIFKSPNVKLAFFKKVDMPESVMKEIDGKKQFVKTGKMEEMTEYTFRDEVGDTFIILSKDNTLRELEGGYVDITIEVKYNDFQKKNRISLASCVKAK